MPIELAKSTLNTRPALRFAGLKIPITERAAQDIPALWQEFMAGQPFNFAKGNTAFGLCIAGQNGTEYMAAVEVQPEINLPQQWVQLTTPAASFEVFPHSQPVWRLRETIEAIFAPGGLTHMHQPINNLAFFEQYTAEYNPQTGLGGISIWVPVQQN